MMKLLLAGRIATMRGRGLRDGGLLMVMAARDADRFPMWIG
jgi:hypothetical protein